MLSTADNRLRRRQNLRTYQGVGDVSFEGEEERHGHGPSELTSSAIWSVLVLVLLLLLLIFFVSLNFATSRHKRTSAVKPFEGFKDVTIGLQMEMEQQPKFHLLDSTGEDFMGVVMLYHSSLKDYDEITRTLTVGVSIDCLKTDSPSDLVQCHSYSTGESIHVLQMMELIELHEDITGNSVIFVKAFKTPSGISLHEMGTSLLLGEKAFQDVFEFREALLHFISLGIRFQMESGKIVSSIQVSIEGPKIESEREEISVLFLIACSMYYESAPLEFKDHIREVLRNPAKSAALYLVNTMEPETLLLYTSLFWFRNSSSDPKHYPLLQSMISFAFLKIREMYPGHLDFAVLEKFTPFMPPLSLDSLENVLSLFFMDSHGIPKGLKLSSFESSAGYLSPSFQLFPLEQAMMHSIGIKLSAPGLVSVSQYSLDVFARYPESLYHSVDLNGNVTPSQIKSAISARALFYFQKDLYLSSAKSKLRGVESRMETYLNHSSPRIFSCFNGDIVELNQLNDDFCDCSDGSDEPGTSACSFLSTKMLHFECPDGKLLYSSFVDDGICDCIECSDEKDVSYVR